MATTTVLSNPNILRDSVDYTDQCTEVVLTLTTEALESTAFGSTARSYTAGLQNNTATVSMMLAYGASEVEANIQALVGTTFTVVVYGTNSQTPSATNPEYTLTGCYLESFTPVNASTGGLQTADLTLTGFTYARAIS